jgi:uncharacterized protein with NAD-binding domain and iron-sulfur cluster
MGQPATPQKVAILGGGIAALSTAFELTSQPGWQDRFDITMYQLGWRLGGKCATGRGPNDRIQEHGIHGFLGCYYNALPMMREVYEALGRKKGEQPLATFDEAFKPESFVLMWEFIDNNWKQWPFTAPTNDHSPADPSSLTKVTDWVHALVRFVHQIFDDNIHKITGDNPIAKEMGKGLMHLLDKAIKGALELGAGLIELLDNAWEWLSEHLGDRFTDNDDLRRIYIVSNFLLAIVKGTIKDDIASKGFDSIDDMNFADWLKKHGASNMTVSSALSLNTTNLSYQYPNGDTTRTATMAAGAYLHWTLRSFAYMGAFAWMFEAGTGETIIAPMYEVLKKRGVKFEFFQKVEALHLSADKKTIASVDIGVQATLKTPAAGYQPLIEVKGLPSWPADPHYDQLVEGEALKAQQIDLESYWTAWKPVAQRTLVAGTDYDKIVFAISIGAVPYLCQELLDQSQAWRDMTANVTTAMTQTMQLWFNRSTKEMGWDYEFKNEYDTCIGATYVDPLDGQVDFTHLLKWESWPQSNMPKSLWYFSGLMPDYDTPPPFTDTDYPRRQHERVKYQCIQYLQASMGPLLPLATSNKVSPPGDPIGLDFSLLKGHDESKMGVGVSRFDQQFWRANIDPTERYVLSPPGSTKYRLKAWGSGFDNLVLAGDWIYTGLNVGSVEGTVMGGRLASFAVSGYPALTQIIGYPTH